MSHVQEGLRYTKEHEWVRLEGNRAYIGITDFAQSELGDIVFVELPEIGAKVEQHQTFGTVESVKTVSDLYSPVSGTIAEANQDLVDHPERVNEEPFGTGWMIAVDLLDVAEFEALLTADEYTALTTK
jgi:glycine cleavage system H protein